MAREECLRGGADAVAAPPPPRRYMQSPQHIRNPLASEFGVYDDKDLLAFLSQTEDLRHFSVILLLDRLEESLTAMKVGGTCCAPAGV